MSGGFVRKWGSEIRRGDWLRRYFDGRCEQVVEIGPYRGPLIDSLGEGTQIAKFPSGQEMTLPAVQWFEVLGVVAD